MNWKPLELSDRFYIEEALKKSPLPLSDYSFTNLWMWNPIRKYRIAEIDRFLCIKFLEEGKQGYLYPIGEGSREPILEKLAMDGIVHMRAIPEHALTSYQITPEPDNFDYIYRFDDLLNLSGNHYQAKRNLIHQFEEYDFEYRAIDEELIPSIREMEIKWFHEHRPAQNEHDAVLHALNDFSSLGALGGALLVGNEVVAYSFAEYLTTEMIVVHVEKALVDYKGAYQMINQQMLKALKPVPFVNREEDLGLPNLRKIKESYHPIRYEKKFKLSFL